MEYMEQKMDELIEGALHEQEMLSIEKLKGLKSGQPCSHPGCLSHISHPCEVCGRSRVECK